MIGTRFFIPRVYWEGRGLSREFDHRDHREFDHRPQTQAEDHTIKQILKAELEGHMKEGK